MRLHILADSTVLDLDNVVMVAPAFSGAYTVTTLFGISIQIVATSQELAEADRARLVAAWAGEQVQAPRTQVVSAPRQAQPAAPVTVPVAQPPAAQVPAAPPAPVPLASDDEVARLLAAHEAEIAGMTPPPPVQVSEGPYQSSFT